MKLSLNTESANALRDLAESMPAAVQNIVESTLKVVSVYQSVSESLGVHRQNFYDLLMVIKLAQEKSTDAIEYLPKMLYATADKIDAYVARTKNTHNATNSQISTRPGVESGSVSNESMHGNENHVTDTRHIEYVTVPYEVTNSNGEKESLSYDMPIVYDHSVSDVMASTLSFGNDATSAKEWAHKAFADWRGSISEDTEEAILIYSSTMEYQTINDANRGNIPMSNGIKDITNSIDKGLNAAVLPQETIVYRGVSENAIVDMALKAGGKLESGIILEDQGFLSTSLIPDTDFMRDSKYVMRLTAIPGLHAAPLEYGDLSRVPRESELLFGRNHNIYIRNVIKARRSDLIPNSNEDEITVIDGVLTI